MKVVAEKFFQSGPTRRRVRSTDDAYEIGDKEYKAEKPKVRTSVFHLTMLARAAAYSASYLAYGKKGVIAAATVDAALTSFGYMSKRAAKGGGIKAAFRGAGRVCKRLFGAAALAGLTYVAGTYGVPVAQDFLFNTQQAGPWRESLSHETAAKLIANGEIKLGSSIPITDGKDTAQCTNVQLSKILKTDEWQVSCTIKGKTYASGRKLVSQSFPHKSMYVDKRSQYIVIGNEKYFEAMISSGMEMKERIKLPGPPETEESLANKLKARKAALRIGL